MDGLYEAAVPVADQGTDTRNAALREAMAAVLVKVTGRRNAHALEASNRLLGQSQRFVQQYRYQQREVLDPQSGEMRHRLHLWVRFDAIGVQRALLEQDVPLWGRERPDTLVWLAYDDGAERALVTPDTAPVYDRVVEETAAARGVPLLQPLMDLEDRSRLPYSDLWGGFEQPIRRASERYAPNAILVGRVYRADRERWGARWILIEGTETRHHESPPGPLAPVIADGVHWVADTFAERFAIVADRASDGLVRMQVDRVSGFEDYMTTMFYLEELSMMNRVQVEMTRADRVVFALDIRGTPEQLEQAIALSGRFDPHPDGHDAEWGARLFRYRIRQ